VCRSRHHLIKPGSVGISHGIKSVRIYPKGHPVPAGHSSQRGIVVSRASSRSAAHGAAPPATVEVAGPDDPGPEREHRPGAVPVTAEAGDHATVAFIPRESFVDFLRDHCGLLHAVCVCSARPARPVSQIPQHQRPPGPSAAPSGGRATQLVGQFEIDRNRVLNLPLAIQIVGLVAPLRTASVLRAPARRLPNDLEV